MIDASDFRDKSLASIHIEYGWPLASSAAAKIVVKNSRGITFTYRLSGLTELSLFEDFECQSIAQCTLVNEPGYVYLCLDPFHEGTPSEEDRFFFKGSLIERELR